MNRMVWWMRDECCILELSTVCYYLRLVSDLVVWRESNVATRSRRVAAVTVYGYVGKAATVRYLLPFRVAFQPSLSGGTPRRSGGRAERVPTI